MPDVIAEAMPFAPELRAYLPIPLMLLRSVPGLDARAISTESGNILNGGRSLLTASPSRKLYRDLSIANPLPSKVRLPFIDRNPHSLSCGVCFMAERRENSSSN